MLKTTDKVVFLFLYFIKCSLPTKNYHLAKIQWTQGSTQCMLTSSISYWTLTPCFYKLVFSDNLIPNYIKK